MKKILLIFFFLLFSFIVKSEENKMILKLEYGSVEIELFPDVAPKHVERFKTLAKNKIESADISATPTDTKGSKL